MNNKLLLITGAAITATSLYSASVLAVTATGSATATVVQAITIVPTTPLAFGEVIATASIQTVIIAPDGTNTGGSVTPTGTTSQGVFTVDGKDAKTYAVTVPGGDVTLTSGGNTIIVNTFTYDGGGVGGVGTPGVVTNGGGPLNIGATLNVGVSQPGGSYVGLYNVSVDYN